MEIPKINIYFIYLVTKRKISQNYEMFLILQIFLKILVQSSRFIKYDKLIITMLTRSDFNIEIDFVKFNISIMFSFSSGDKYIVASDCYVSIN